MNLVRFLLVTLACGGVIGCSSNDPVVEPVQESVAVQPPNDAAKAMLAAAEEQANQSKSKPSAADPVSTVPPLEEPSSDGNNRLTEAELQEGWLRLFDGETLFGWTKNSETDWSVVDGTIVGSGETPGLLVTTTRWANYVLKVDFRIADQGNSGIFLRTPLQPKNPVTDCYELNICDTHPEFKSGSLVGRAQPSEVFSANGDWHTFEVTVNGPAIEVKFDNQTALSYTDTAEQPLVTGYIGLQMNGGQAEFRNVFLKPLGLSSLFDGETLTGWRVVPGSAGTFEVKDETIQATGGRGFLETERTAANFVLQFEAITHGDALNSGVFFRAEPGTEEHPSDGYEFQIQNGFKDGDRNQPADHGTGAIFRRASARRVISADHQWLHATLVADGPHFTTWVDGVQVVDWIDDRPANPNPRQGLRLEAGHFSLQGHDPTTDLQFRNLRLVDLP